MRLRVLIPSGIFVDEPHVHRISAETREGSIGLLPHRLDCVASLAPGILAYETEGGTTSYLAVDEGVMAKTGADVLISVRRAIGGAGLSQLHDAVRHEFLRFDEQEQDVRIAVARMEGGLIRRLAEFQHAR